MPLVRKVINADRLYEFSDWDIHSTLSTEQVEQTKCRRCGAPCDYSRISSISCLPSGIKGRDRTHDFQPLVVKKPQLIIEKNRETTDT